MVSRTYCFFLLMLCVVIGPIRGGDPSGAAVSGPGSGTVNLNLLLGADRYTGHSTPITGQNSVSTNLEAGHIWNGHETLAHVSSFTHHADAWGSSATDLMDRHATWAAMFIGGRQTPGGGAHQTGLAPGTDLRSAAIATKWNGSAYSLNFSINFNTLVAAYTTPFTTSDVVNSSYGFSDSAGDHIVTRITDGAAYESPRTTHVVSAGNSGSSSNTVGSPGAGYNTMTVGALAPGSDSAYDSVATFSSRSPQDFGYINETEDAVTVAGVRAAVDISAPGQDLVSAFYGGQTGGNNTDLTDSSDDGSADNLYTYGIGGTSFAAPIVAGGSALVASAARTLPELSGNDDARQSVVVKSLLLTGADKTSGWSNGQTAVTDGGGTYVSTDQSLDWAVGAGRMNLNRTFDIQVNGQRDVAGTSIGALGTVEDRGWDYGFSQINAFNDYILEGDMLEGNVVNATLSWLRIRNLDAVNETVSEIAQADLNLSVWKLDASLQFDRLVAESVSAYNTVEHLHFDLPEAGRYGLRIEYAANTFDNTVGDLWGTTGFEQDYGLAWETVVIPEPAVWIMLTGLALSVLGTRARRGGPPRWGSNG